MSQLGTGSSRRETAEGQPGPSRWAAGRGASASTQPRRAYPTQPDGNGQPDGNAQSGGNGPEGRVFPGRGPSRNGRPADPRKLALIVGACVLGLALVIAGALLFRDYRAGVAEQRAAEAAALAEAERRAEQTRQEAAAGASAQGYLNALAASDAEGALGFAAAPPEGNTGLLTREVLAEANERAAITEVSIDGAALTEDSPGEWASGTVQARYSIGGQPQAVNLPVRKVGEEWKLDQVSASVDLGVDGPERLVNGATVAPGAYRLFPGSYSVTSTNPLIGLEATDFLLASPVDPSTEWKPVPVLSDEGRDQSLAASKRAVEECLQSNELAPPTCPFIRWREGSLTVDKDSIRYTLRNDPWENVDFRFYGGTMTAAATVEVTHGIEAQAVKDGVRGTVDATDQTLPAYITVKLADGTPHVSFS